ncbi:hypothetical protein ABIB94_007068 [Bradyrhizobium sp. JR7.2]|uniref:helix-turn-helix domain-containing protein n=1 Tax=Bradyrhizobium sp. JR7.2 TaxID=3156375 RepID=UPI00339217A0
MSRQLEENIDYASINRKRSDAFLARLVKFHTEAPRRGEPVPPHYDDDDLAPRTMMVRRIQQLVCREFKITMKDLLAFSRVPALALPRQVAYYLAKENTMLSLPGIGRKFGRDHSTVHHGVGIIRKRIQIDPDLARIIRRIEEQLQ